MKRFVSKNVFCITLFFGFFIQSNSQIIQQEIYGTNYKEIGFYQYIKSIKYKLKNVKVMQVIPKIHLMMTNKNNISYN